MQLFVLVSTGQRIANIPPVLEYARVGDHVVWIESQEAARNHWTEAPQRLLENRGLLTVATIRVRHVNDPVDLSNQLTPFAQSVQGQYEATYLVANGGTKLSPIGLFFGLESLNPQILYGDERPAVHNLYPAGLNESPRVAPYTRHTLDLPEILQLNGYQFLAQRHPLQIWPQPLPAEYDSERYGQDEEYTYQLHRDHARWAAARRSQEFVPFGELFGLVDTNVIQRWYNTFQLARRCPNPQNLTSLYHGTINLAEQGRVAAGRRQLPPPQSDLGRSFEWAVVRRVREWLDRVQHPAVQSAWSNVIVAREGLPDRCDAEFDVLVVLKNGILVAFECKAAQVDDRDLEVNFHRLRQATSRLAHTAIVIPIYTRASHEPWFLQQHQTREAITTRFGPSGLVAFTWPGQPTQYTLPNNPSHETFECPDFESSLETLLSGYRP
ncbi:MAG: hypothetical protein RMJ56_17165 [Gemmataceae bacterium]|nr:hypothetical protein [Gemmata sp.]MDW8199327.1 hypothetical protein [Gemmataceae bacterium]